MKRKFLIQAFGVVASLIFSEAVLASDVRNNSSKTSDNNAGVGLILVVKDERYFIQQIVNNCPASRNKAIKVGDEIVKLRSIGTSPWITLKGLPPEEVKKLMRGKYDDLLTLELKNSEKNWVEYLLRQNNC